MAQEEFHQTQSKFEGEDDDPISPELGLDFRVGLQQEKSYEDESQSVGPD